MINKGDCESLSELLNRSEEMENEVLFSGARENMADTGVNSHVNTGEKWSSVEQRRKRARQNTGSVEMEAYESLDINAKLNVLFGKIQERV
ncbi:hypothetical protein DPMN_188804 [Dreissena polymorpha]|uniref:Uncharacterized protein n=1 Tax=Dreissena polymorpha TaxID=45954 RepID=A0A9D4DQS5_DREPO|nr:hypothetical protein DPMN_188804 [Dreissena polymorpha]